MFRGRDPLLRLRRAFESRGRARRGTCAARPDPHRRGGLVEKGRAMKHSLSVLAMLSVLALAAFVAVTKASPPSGVTPTILARGTFPSFKVRSDPLGPIAGFRARSKRPIDIVVRRHDYAPGATTGWHQHPGPIFITVTQGQLTYYERNDPTCTPHLVSAGQGFVDTGHGHIVRN